MSASAHNKVTGTGFVLHWEQQQQQNQAKMYEMVVHDITSDHEDSGAKRWKTREVTPGTVLASCLNDISRS